MLVAVLALSGCKKATHIYPSQYDVAFSKAGGKVELSVTADGRFDVQGCPEWLQVEVSDTMMVFTAQENSSGAAREAQVKLVGDNVEETVTVRQAYMCTRITATPEAVTLPKEGGTKDIAITTDGAHLDIQVSDGITAEFNDDTLTVSAPANDGPAINGVVTIVCDTVKTEVKVAVEGSVCPSCGGTGKVKCTKCGGKGVYYFVDAGVITYGCPRCGGGGSDCPDDLHRGSGKMPCPTCGGKGR